MCSPLCCLEGDAEFRTAISNPIESTRRCAAAKFATVYVNLKIPTNRFGLHAPGTYPLEKRNTSKTPRPIPQDPPFSPFSKST